MSWRFLATMPAPERLGKAVGSGTRRSPRPQSATSRRPRLKSRTPSPGRAGARKRFQPPTSVGSARALRRPAAVTSKAARARGPREARERQPDRAGAVEVRRAAATRLLPAAAAAAAAVVVVQPLLPMEARART